MTKALRMIPLGGCGEFGRNITAYEGVPDAEGVRPIVVVDCGAQFPEVEAPGVELFLPDFRWLAAERERVVAWVITHAHEDHLRALPRGLAAAPAPVYGRPFTMRMAENLLREHGMRGDLHVLSPGSIVELGGFSLEALPVAHSIPDACAIALTSGGSTIVHTGDLKLELDDEGRADLTRLEAIGARGVALLALDSTNATRPGRSRREADVEIALRDAVAACKQRVLVTQFASNVGRVAALCRVAQACDRQICFIGRGLRETTEIGRSLGLLRPPAELVIGEDAASWAPPDKVLLVATGSQGEPLSALGKLASDQHRKLALDPGDAVIFSSRPVPGNELRVERIVDELLERGIVIVDRPELHASGHAAIDELSELIRALRPAVVAPLHGRARQLEALATLAEGLGVQVARVRDGDVWEIGAGAGARRIGEVPSGRVSLEGQGPNAALGDIGPATLKDRIKLSRGGLVLAGRDAQGQWTVRAFGVCELPALAPILKAVLEALGPTTTSEAASRAIGRVFERARGVRPAVVVL